MKLAAGTFLAGAKSRLLPASIPFRYFGAAVVYHLLAWLALAAGADALPRLGGGLSAPLAALHLVTLGVLVMTAMGASLQLLPVATRQPMSSTRWQAAIWWVYTPGVAMVALGMGIAAPTLLAVGAVAVAAALAAYAVLLVRNLLGAKGMPVVVTHGWIAVASLIVVLATALSLAGGYLGAAALARPTALALHVVFAAYGFMGMLAFGFSYILVPMFALSAAPDEKSALTSAVLGVAALLLAATAAFGIAPTLAFVAAIVLGAIGVALHLRLMLGALETGLRRELGRSFQLVRVSWVLLGVGLIVALALALEAPINGAAALFVVLLIPGWLLTFLLGILQRIVPFLASMHATRKDSHGKRLPPIPSSLTAERPLAIHFVCHLAALGLLMVGVVADSPGVIYVAALVGTTGAAAFAVFFLIVLLRMTRGESAAKASAMRAA